MTPIGSLRMVAAVLRRPSLWATAARQARRTTAPGWWRRSPFLPVPSGDYLRFRMQTQYGDTDRAPDTRDVVNYLVWCREWDRSTVGAG